ncbi:MAG: hypothetical protein ACI4Q6_05185 [Huintestinicola sp.]
MEDLRLFKEELAACSKGELIDIISDHADRNYLFERFVREKIKHSDNADEILKGFMYNYIETLDDPSSASVDILCEGGDVFLEKMEKVADSVSKVKAYLTVINELDDILDGGIGWYDDDDWLVVDIANKCMQNILKMAKSAAQSGDEQYSADFKKYVSSAELSDGCVGLGNMWEEVRNVFSD